MTAGPRNLPFGASNQKRRYGFTGPFQIPIIPSIPAIRITPDASRQKMSMFPPNIQTLSGIFNTLYIGALVVGAISGTGIIYCSNRLQRSANLQIAEANRTAALANERAEELAKENLEIRKQMADRFLTEEEKKLFISAIRSPGRVVTITFIEDREATAYALMLEAEFKSAGWNAGRQYRRQYDPDPIPQGIICRVAKKPDPAVQAVVSALEKFRAKPRIEEVPTARPDFLDVVVGAKP
jgi:hypothetical protein